MTKRILIIALKKNIQQFLAKFSDSDNDVTLLAWDEVFDEKYLSSTELDRFSYIVVAIEAETVAKLVCEYITKNRTQKSGIIDYYLCLRGLMPRMKVDQKMLSEQSYEGVMLGISYAELGFLPERMSIPFCNLAIASQDIYYNYLTLKYCLENYPEYFANLKYVVIDMFDYTYINFDTSLASVGGAYLWNNGGYILDPHHFDDNKNYSFTYADMISQMKSEIDSQLGRGNYEAFTEIFDEYEELKLYCRDKTSLSGRGIPERMKTYVYDEEAENISFGNGLIHKVHNETISENIDILNELLKMVYGFNPDMKVIFLVMPQNGETNRHKENELAMWKEMFYEVVDTMKKMYPVELWDMKNCELSEDLNNFWDFAHLNYIGAIKFTDLFDEKIRELM